jgi:excisionase family DNA binding protein
MLRPKEVCQRLGISYRTLQSYVKKGYIKPVILESGKWRFKEEDVEKLMGIVRKRKVILYARVSSNTQKDDLVKQVKYLQEQVKDYDQVITDVGSGLNVRREGFLKLLRMILNNEVSKVVAYPDSLVRFNFEIIEEVCKAHNCEIVVLDDEDKTPEQEIIEDLVSILVSFSGKLYGMRSHKYENVRKCVEELKN